MRIRIGEYEYEVIEVTNGVGAKMAALTRWAFIVYRVTSAEELIARGEGALSREHAERNARQLIELYIELDGKEIQ